MVNTITRLINQYPEAVAILLSMLLSWSPGLILETWFLPPAWPDRKMKQVTLSITVAVAFVSATVLWHLLDPVDSKGVVGLTSLIAALSAPFVHVGAAAVLTHYFPYLDSVFKFKGKAGG
jgi:hypothetical protein